MNPESLQGSPSAVSRLFVSAYVSSPRPVIVFASVICWCVAVVLPGAWKKPRRFAAVSSLVAPIFTYPKVPDGLPGRVVTNCSVIEALWNGEVLATTKETTSPSCGFSLSTYAERASEDGWLLFAT